MAVRNFYNTPLESAQLRAASDGTGRARLGSMGVRRYRDLFAWQLANGLKTEVYRLLETHTEAARRWKYRDQLLESVSAVPKDIAEGFVRYSPAQFARFLDYGLASLAEAEEWLIDGVELKYWPAEDGRAALLLAKRAFVAMLRLKQSQERELRKRRQAPPVNRGRARRPTRTEEDGERQ